MQQEQTQPKKELTVQEYRKQYYEANKEKLKKQVLENYNNNKDRWQNYNRQYIQQNSEVLRQKRNVKNTCSCGGKYTSGNESTHCKSKKHQVYINKVLENSKKALEKSVSVILENPPFENIN
jgi:hypothetical protein